MLGLTDYGAFCAAILLFLALPGPGAFALLTSTSQGGFRAGAAATLGVIVFYMAFSPLFIDPARHQGGSTSIVMAATIAALTAIYGLTLCAFAQAVSKRVRAHRRLARLLERAAGVFLVGFGIRLGSQ